MPNYDTGKKPRPEDKLEVIPSRSVEQMLVDTGWGYAIVAALYPKHWQSYVHAQKSKGREI